MERILVIDDQAGMRRSLSILLKKAGFSVEEAENGEQAIQKMKTVRFTLVITDLKMSPGTGLDVLYFIEEKHPETAVIIMTGYGTVDSAVLAMKMGAFDYIAKPFKHEEIIHRVRKALGHSELARELTSIGNSSNGGHKTSILGHSEAVTCMRSLIEKIAAVDLPALITGETGTGKNLVAKTLHALSTRGNKPFVSINCAAVPEYLLESELFGHTKGAFTGAILDRKGLFEAAEDGTLLLDEIGCMPVTMQAKLLDVLQERQIRSVGSTKTKKVNVRILTATNTDLERAIREGKFREDLYYRIKVSHIHIQPLREHPEDIPFLAEHFLNTLRKEFAKPHLRLAPDAVEFLLGYAYPGNIRELQNIISSAAAISSSEVISSQDLSIGYTSTIFDVNDMPKGGVQPATLEEWERDLIARSMKKNSRNLVSVCNELGIGRTTLWRKIKKYNI